MFVPSKTKSAKLNFSRTFSYYQLRFYPVLLSYFTSTLALKLYIVNLKRHYIEQLKSNNNSGFMLTASISIALELTESILALGLLFANKYLICHASTKINKEIYEKYFPNSSEASPTTQTQTMQSSSTLTTHISHLTNDGNDLSLSFFEGSAKGMAGVATLGFCLYSFIKKVNLSKFSRTSPLVIFTALAFTAMTHVVLGRMLHKFDSKNTKALTTKTTAQTHIYEQVYSPTNTNQSSGQRKEALLKFTGELAHLSYSKEAIFPQLKEMLAGLVWGSCQAIVASSLDRTNPSAVSTYLSSSVALSDVLKRFIASQKDIITWLGYRDRIKHDIALINALPQNKAALSQRSITPLRATPSKANNSPNRALITGHLFPHAAVYTPIVLSYYVGSFFLKNHITKLKRNSIIYLTKGLSNNFYYSAMLVIALEILDQFLHFVLLKFNEYNIAYLAQKLNGTIYDYYDQSDAHLNFLRSQASSPDSQQKEASHHILYTTQFSIKLATSQVDGISKFLSCASLLGSSFYGLTTTISSYCSFSKTTIASALIASIVLNIAIGYVINGFDSKQSAESDTKTKIHNQQIKMAISTPGYQPTDSVFKNLKDLCAYKVNKELLFPYGRELLSTFMWCLGHYSIIRVLDINNPVAIAAYLATTSVIQELLKRFNSAQKEGVIACKHFVEIHNQLLTHDQQIYGAALVRA
jgi:hypothetical protein